MANNVDGHLFCPVEKIDGVEEPEECERHEEVAVLLGADVSGKGKPDDSEE